MIWDFDPVAFSILGLPVRWYGLVYVLGFLITVIYGQKICSKMGVNIPKKDFENLVFGLFIAGVIGGRIGHFLFYSPSTFIENPIEILKLWHGGMSIHGGILGAMGYGLWWTKKKNFSFLRLADIFVIPLAIALIFGRLTNFINGELVGIPTQQDWGVIFPHIDDQLRHPSQLYEMGKNIILTGILVYFFQKEYWRRPGFLFSVFLIGYGILRFGIEFFREPDGMIWIFSTGQLLCLTMIAAAIWLGIKQKLVGSTK